MFFLMENIFLSMEFMHLIPKNVMIHFSVFFFMTHEKENRRRVMTDFQKKKPYVGHPSVV